MLKIQNFPSIVLLRIFLKSAPETIAAMAKANSHFEKIANDDLWKTKFQLHFPHLFETLKTKNITNWLNEFKEAYLNEYQGLSEETRRLFSLVKEGDITELKKTIKLTDLDLSDINFITLRQWAKKKGHQTLLNYFYQLAIEEHRVRSNVNTARAEDENDNDDDNYERTLLHWAILCHQSAETVRNLILQQGEKVDAIWMYNTTPLYLAALEGLFDIVQVLLNNHADVDDKRFNNNNEDESNDENDYSDKYRDDDGKTPLSIAIEMGHRDIAELLLNNNANPHAARFKDGATPLYIAAKRGDSILVRALLAKGALVDQASFEGKTPLYIAAKKRHHDIVRILLENHADVNAIPNDEDCATLLCIATENGDFDVVQTLLENHADANRANAVDAAPLHIAAENGIVDIAKILLANGAHINATCTYDSTPLYLAAKNGHLDVVALLLANNADVSIGDNWGVTPRDIAEQNGHKDIVLALDNHIALLNHPNKETTSQFEAPFAIFGGHTSNTAGQFTGTNEQPKP